MLLLPLAAGFFVCSLVNAAPLYTLNVNSSLTAEDPMFKGLNQFKAAVEKRSAGQLEVKLFPSSQLGSDEDVLEQARADAASGNAARAVRRTLGSGIRLSAWDPGSAQHDARAGHRPA